MFGEGPGNRLIHSELREGREGSGCFDVSPRSSNDFITPDR